MTQLTAELIFSVKELLKGYKRYSRKTTLWKIRFFRNNSSHVYATDL